MLENIITHLDMTYKNTKLIYITSGD
jgi:hypothetical protein